jgi:hypothetical protein
MGGPVNSNAARKLCEALLYSNTEGEVIAHLTKANFWDDPKCWRRYGDSENNWSEAGNQQSRSDAALIEKLVNSIDARLTNECVAAGLDPEGPKAPQSIREAVARFIEKHPKPTSEAAGRIRDWDTNMRSKVARDITLAATGFRPTEGKPCFTIVDRGEGQTPDRFPDTLLSLNRTNKLRIPFVQGKFNMGGTGVLKFCGKHNLQLVLSRRNPALVPKKAKQSPDTQWGFAIVRRENPEGTRRSSVYTYLAPIGAAEAPNEGGVLRFDADKMPIFPNLNEPYARESEWGTLIKLYEYSASGYSNSHILRGDGLMERVDLLLPDLALPIRFHECRDFKGHAGSFDTNVNGLGVRLFDDKFKNLEEGFPTSAPISVMNEKMTATIFAFKPQRADNYRKNEGVIFVLNGQTHGHLTFDFFRRKNVNLSYLRNSLLVMVDCSDFSGRAREDFFMNSRDRLSGGELRTATESALEDLLRHHPGLRELAERRRREEVKKTLEENKPLKDVLEDLIKQSPSLASLFALGSHVSNPFKSTNVSAEEKPYDGKPYPTYFKFRDKKYGETLTRGTAVNMRARIMFETDAANEYFDKNLGKGAFTLFRETVAGSRFPFSGYVGPNLSNGSATLSVELPENSQPGDTLHFAAEVSDDSRVEPFINRFVVHVNDPIETSGKPGEKKKPPSEKKGADHNLPTKISLPEVTLVAEKDWANHEPPFDKFTALRVRQPSTPSEDSADAPLAFDFFVNIDNIHLLRELKATKDSPEVVKKRFELALTLLGLGLLQDEQKEPNPDKNTSSSQDSTSPDNGEPNVEDKIEAFTKAVAPILLPMIAGLGALQEESLASATEAAGEAV